VIANVIYQLIGDANWLECLGRSYWEGVAIMTVYISNIVAETGAHQ
jgi:hypothetical protein